LNLAMIRDMRYPGGKGKTYQHLINHMPPHRVYIESHLGGGAVMRMKRPADVNIGIDLDAEVVRRNAESEWTSPSPRQLHHADAVAFLSTYRFEGNELVYADPPYHPSTRRRIRVYRHDYDHEQHVALLTLLRKLP
jgi:site-specific DNA-adenine methylase